jgi:hypothetical protein
MAKRRTPKQSAERGVRDWLALTLSLLAIAIGLVGCGSSSSAGGTQAATTASSAQSSAPSSSASTSSTAASSPSTSSTSASQVASPTHTAQAPQKLVAEAEQICGPLNKRLEKIVARGFGTSEILSLVRRRSALQLAASTRLARLSPPPSSAHEWHEMLTLRSELTQNLMTLAAAAKANQHQREGEALKANEEVERKLQPLGEGLGLKECAKGS